MKLPKLKKPGDPVTARDQNLLIEALRGLGLKPEDRTQRRERRRQRRDRFLVSFADSKMSLTPGRTTVYGKGLAVPVIPLFEGGRLEDSDRPGKETPFWDAAGLGEAGKTYWVLIRFSSEAAQIFVHDSEEELPKLKAGEFVSRLATFVLTSWQDSEGNTVYGPAVGSLVQEVESDIDVTEQSQFGASSSGSGPDIPDGSSSNPPPPSSSNPPPPSSSSGGGGTSSGKSNAIVPALWRGPGRYAALYCVEAPEVRFEDVMTIRVVKSRMAVPIDLRFVQVCNPGSIVCVGVAGDRPYPVGVQVVGGMVHLRAWPWAWWARPRVVVLKLSGIRRGMGHDARTRRFAERTQEQFEDNERFYNSAYSWDLETRDQRPETED
jgi:hypothetical protein